MGHFYRTVLSSAWTQTSLNLARTQGDHRCLTGLFQSSDISLHFQRLKVEWCKNNQAKFSTFCPPLSPVKNRGGVSEISRSMNEASAMIGPLKYICAAAETGVLIKEKKKESSAAFISLSTNAGRPNWKPDRFCLTFHSGFSWWP